MSPSGDYSDEMAPAPHDDSPDELVPDLDGDPVLGPFVADLRRLAVEPAPVPSAALAAVLAGIDPPAGDPADELAARRRSKVMAPIRTVAGLSLAAKIALGVGVAAAATGAAAADVLPAPVQDGVAEIVSVATPFELPTSAERATFGQTVRGDATDDEPGVDGKAVAEAARQNGLGARPDDAGAKSRAGDADRADDDHADDDDAEHDDESGEDGPHGAGQAEAGDGHSSTAPRGVPTSTPVANGGGAGPDQAKGNVPPAGSGGNGRK